MAMRGTALILAMMGLVCGLRITQAQNNTPLPTDRAGMTNQLIARTRESYLANVELSKARPQETFEIVRDHWKDLTSDESKQKLLFALVHSDNPHLLEILDIGVNDSEASVQALAYDLLQGFAYSDFSKDPAAYRTWHKEILGKPVAEVVATGCKKFVTHYLQTEAVDRTSTFNISSLFNMLMSQDFDPTTELAKVRRRAALDAGLMDAIERALKPPFFDNDVAAVSLARENLALLRKLQPEEAIVRRVIVPLMSPNASRSIRREAQSFLFGIKNTWASDILFDMLQEDYRDPSRERWSLIAGLSNSTDPHLIPKMIAVMEVDDSPQTAQLMGFALPRLTGRKQDGLHDGAWWHLWWDRNKANFPADVRAVPYPKIPIHKTLEARGFLQRRTERHLLGDDPQRTYWLLSPAYISPTTAQETPARKPTFGLIVVLADSSDNYEDLIDFWKNAIQKSLKDGYFVAVPIAPKWIEHQPVTWITRQNMTQVKEARFATETFLNDVAADVSANYPIDPNRLFLHGIGEGGLATYACSLNASTPFRGFYLLSSPFKTSQLPPLPHARGRHYLIQQSKEDKITPYFQALAADELLRKQGAIVKLTPTLGEHGYKFADSPWEQIAQAIGYLEASR
ncbi:MAG: Phospholipase/Carboxylesterase [Chthonomonadales bacterium]|nr:Phospholipase/Carboxylesterase [Chthonomonadales bacterium]